jgi:hypothetical protein
MRGRQPVPAAPARVQTGVRMERRLVKVLKAVAELHDLSLGELLESIVQHAFAGELSFNAAGLSKVRELMGIYGATHDAPAQEGE